MKRNGDKFEVEIKNGRTNDLKIDSDSFRIVKRDGDKVTYYEGVVKDAIDGWAVPKGQTFKTTVTAKDDPVLGANVTLQFRPDDAYDEMFASWIYGNGWAVPKGQTFKTTVTAKDDPVLGANVTLQFRPDDAYDEMFASWIYGKTEK